MGFLNEIYHLFIQQTVDNDAVAVFFQAVGHFKKGFLDKVVQIHVVRIAGTVAVVEPNRLHLVKFVHMGMILIKIVDADVDQRIVFRHHPARDRRLSRTGQTGQQFQTAGGRIFCFARSQILIYPVEYPFFFFLVQFGQFDNLLIINIAHIYESPQLLKS